MDAAFNELGLTSPLLPDENRANSAAGKDYATRSPGTRSCRTFEHSSGYLSEVIDFQRLMAAPPQHPFRALRGSDLQQHRATCHTRATPTTIERNGPPRGRDQPYSDFLLHDMPSIPDGIHAGDAGGSEIRTPALWGLRTRTHLMHDGSANSPLGGFDAAVTEAILAHGPVGEAAGSAAQFEALAPEEQDLLLAFLGSLGRPDFDVDLDGVRDQDDIELAIGCLGPADPDTGCGTGDLDRDGVVDSTDVSTLYRSAGLFEDCNQNGVDDTIDIELVQRRRRRQRHSR